MTTDTRKLLFTDIAFKVSYSVFQIDVSGIELNEGINNRSVPKAQMTMKMSSSIRAVTAQSIFFFYSDTRTLRVLSSYFILNVCLR